MSCELDGYDLGKDFKIGPLGLLPCTENLCGNRLSRKVASIFAIFSSKPYACSLKFSSNKLIHRRFLSSSSLILGFVGPIGLFLTSHVPTYWSEHWECCDDRALISIHDVDSQSVYALQYNRSFYFSWLNSVDWIPHFSNFDPPHLVIK